MPQHMRPMPPNTPRRPVHPEPPAVPPKRHLKWYLPGVLLLVLFALWLARTIQPAYSWVECMDALHVRYEHRDRFTMMATIGVLICGGLAILRIWRSDRKKT